VALSAGAASASAELDGGRSHARDLLPAIERLCAELGCEAPPRSLDTIFVGTGPGSYTGLRVGIACAQGLAWASGARLVGVPSFELLAFLALREGEHGAVACDVRAGAYAFAAYRRSSDDVQALVAPRLVAHGRLAQHARGLVAIADAAALEELERDLPDGERRALPRADAAALFVLGAHRARALAPVAPREVEPLYLREFGEHA